MSIATLGTYLVSGLTTGSVFAMIAVGFTLVYNTCDLINFAQGEFAMLGGMLAVTFVGLHLPLWLALTLAILGAAVFGGGLALSTIYPLRRVSPLGLIIITIGLSIVLRGGAMLIWGKDARLAPTFVNWPPIRLAIGGGIVVIQWQAVWVLLAAALVALGLFLFFKYSNTGRAMRASAVNHRGAQICGINPRRVMVLALALSAGIGAVGGVTIAPLNVASYDMGIMLGLNGFCAAIIGGLSSIAGAIAGGLLLGVLEALGSGLVSSHLKEMLAFLALLGILFLRPAGLFGGRRR